MSIVPTNAEEAIKAEPVSYFNNKEGDAPPLACNFTFERSSF
jgi:hypothetical protein